MRAPGRSAGNGVQLPLQRSDADNACIFVGVRLTRGREERGEILAEIVAGGYQMADLSDDEMAKLHVRYVVGGRPSKPLR
ncbi:MAG: hypothetical protein ACR5LG_06370 [Sodalis sp. (in: enterobacteria)]|uniref:hypothetical protein n=1 Tax=Sodalis sp. (in: enterobacteria) TaxID=1898979 RepID=UPI003F31A0ED